MQWMALLGSFSLAIAADEPLPKVSRAPKPLPAGVAPAIVQALDSSAYVVKDDAGDMAIYWFRAVVPFPQTAKSASYDSLQEGTLIGVVQILRPGLTDFRDQKLPPGVFTLRQGVQPQDGNHMGVAPSLEFLCLSPVAKDTKLEPIPHDPLMKLSKEAAGTGHPAVLYLQPFDGPPKISFPTVNTNEQSHILLNVRLPASLPSGKSELPLAIVIVGITTQA